jgi:two-component system nitrogen regulation response regulator NtrX
MSDILIVDDERDIRELISDILEDEGYATRRAGNSDEAMAAIAAEQPGLLILDIWLKDSQMDGIDILKTVKRDYPDVPVVIISGHGNIEIAVAAIKQGAYDFIEKPFNIDQLMVVIRRGMETSRLRRENQALKRRETAPSEMLGDAPAFRNLIGQLDKVTKSNGRVMLAGPAGSGKELAARYIHANSNRVTGPFVTVGCASIAADRMEEVLFGRESTDLFRRGGRHAARYAVQDPACAGRSDFPAGWGQRQDQGRSAGDLLDQPRSGGRDRRRPVSP